KLAPYVSELLSSKRSNKTVLYRACENGQMSFVSMLIEYYQQSVNNAGPYYSPNALSVAAQNGHYETVAAIMELWNKVPSGRTRQQVDKDGRHALHYIAQHPYAINTPQAKGAQFTFGQVLFGGG